MWFKSIDKEQFTRFALQESRLNNAYWSWNLLDHIESTLGIGLVGSQPNSPLPSGISSEPSAHTKKLKINLQQDILQSLNVVEQGLDDLRGLPREIIYHHLNFVRLYCQMHTDVINIQSSNETVALQISDDEKASYEMDFIRQRGELIPGEDLMTEWDRSVYTLYDILQGAQSGDGNPGNSEISPRLIVASNLMSPSLIKLSRYCYNYSSHLELPRLAKVKIYRQYMHDCKRLFSVGRQIVQYTSDSMSVINAISKGISDEDQQDLLSIQNQAITMEENLITASLDISGNLIREIILAGR